MERSYQCIECVPHQLSAKKLTSAALALFLTSECHAHNIGVALSNVVGLVPEMSPVSQMWKVGCGSVPIRKH